MTNTTIDKYRGKILWFILPFVITLITWMIVSLYSLTTSVAVLSEHNYEQQSKDASNKYVQEKILQVAQESRKFSMENNNILVTKADKTDFDRLNVRLCQIEDKVNKIYIQNSMSLKYEYEYEYDTNYIYLYDTSKYNIGYTYNTMIYE